MKKLIVLLCLALMTQAAFADDRWKEINKGLYIDTQSLPKLNEFQRPVNGGSMVVWFKNKPSQKPMSIYIDCYQRAYTYNVGAIKAPIPPDSEAEMIFNQVCGKK
jgi:hypothetical protein